MRLLLGLFGGLGRLAVADLVRCRVVDLADVVGLDRESLVRRAAGCFHGPKFSLMGMAESRQQRDASGVVGERGTIANPRRRSLHPEHGR